MSCWKSFPRSFFKNPHSHAKPQLFFHRFLTLILVLSTFSYWFLVFLTVFCCSSYLLTILCLYTFQICCLAIFYRRYFSLLCIVLQGFLPVFVVLHSVSTFSLVSHNIYNYWTSPIIYILLGAIVTNYSSLLPIVLTFFQSLSLLLIISSLFHSFRLFLTILPRSSYLSFFSFCYRFSLLFFGFYLLIFVLSSSSLPLIVFNMVCFIPFIYSSSLIFVFHDLIVLKVSNRFQSVLLEAKSHSKY